MDIEAVVSAVSGVKSAYELAQSLVTSKIDGAAKAKVSELTRILADAQLQTIHAQLLVTELHSRCTVAEEKVVQVENFAREAERYELHQLPSGSFAYTVKPGLENGEPRHAICANCHSKREKSILQVIPSERGFRRLGCPRCKTEILSERIPRPTASAIPSTRSAWLDRRG